MLLRQSEACMLHSRHCRHAWLTDGRLHENSLWFFGCSGNAALFYTWWITTSRFLSTNEWIIPCICWTVILPACVSMHHCVCRCIQYIMQRSFITFHACVHLKDMQPQVKDLCWLTKIVPMEGSHNINNTYRAGTLHYKLWWCSYWQGCCWGWKHIAWPHQVTMLCSKSILWWGRMCNC